MPIVARRYVLTSVQHPFCGTFCLFECIAKAHVPRFSAQGPQQDFQRQLRMSRSQAACQCAKYPGQAHFDPRTRASFTAKQNPGIPKAPSKYKYDL